MIPFYKILSLVVRVFAKPIISKTKDYHLGFRSDDHTMMKKFFIICGNSYHRFETKINKDSLKILEEGELYIKPLNPTQAIEKGIDIFYELLLYGIIIGFPIYELYRAENASMAQSQSLNKNLGKFSERV